MSFKQDNRWILLFSLAVILLTSLPYTKAASQAGDDWVFTGFIVGVDDGNSYIAKMLNGARGDWLFRSPYTHAEQRGALLYLPYLLLGKTIGPNGTHAEFVIVFHLFRVVAVIAACLATYAFIALFTDDRFFRRLGLVVVTLGGGLGWVTLLAGQSHVFGSLPLEYYSPEAFGFLSLFGIPHLALARALLLWALALYFRPVQANWLIAPIWFGLALTHPINAALGLFLISLHLLFIMIRPAISKHPDLNLRKRHVLLAFFCSGAPLSIILLQYATDPYLQDWAAQNLITSPHPAHYLLAYGLLLPFATLGLRVLLRKETNLASFATIWLIALPVLLYLPINLQRRFAEGAWALLVGLVLYFFESAAVHKRRLALGLFSLTIPSTLALIWGAWQEANQLEPPVFRPFTEVEAFSFFTYENPKPLVLSSFETGNALPAWSPVQVLIGHGPESVGFEAISEKVERVTQEDAPDIARLQLITEFGVDYVFWGPSERSLGNWSPGSSSFLEKVFALDGYEIYRVINE